MILQNYKFISQLGTGFFGDILLIQNSTGQQSALKIASKNKIAQYPNLKNSIQIQKDSMLSIIHQNVMQLEAYHEDNDNKYYICQYCQGGDLLSYQAKQPNKVFDLKSATKILSDVLRGIDRLHRYGYIHRDLKLQNILLKKSEYQDEYVFKVAGFGFPKNCEDSQRNCVLKSQNFMAPELFSGEEFSYETDIWAFGVIFYFMLNMQFPFSRTYLNISQRNYEPIKKAQSLILQSTNFSYRESIQKSKKNIIQNCTEDVEDFFKKIFTPNKNQRITLKQITQHPLFTQHFTNCCGSHIIIKPNKKTILTDAQNARKQYQLRLSQEKQEDGLKKLDIVLDRYQFLKFTAMSLPISFSFLGKIQLFSLQYCLLKYYLILLRGLEEKMNPYELAIKYSSYNWSQISNKPQFTIFKQKLTKKVTQAELFISQSYRKCKKIIHTLKISNPILEQDLQHDIQTTQFSGKFKLSYRTSTSKIYQIVRQKLNEDNFTFLTAVIAICHSFNQIIDCSESQLEKLFQDFVKDGRSTKAIRFSQLRVWMLGCSKQKLKNVIRNVLKFFAN